MRNGVKKKLSISKLRTWPYGLRYGPVLYSTNSLYRKGIKEKLQLEGQSRLDKCSITKSTSKMGLNSIAI